MIVTATQLLLAAVMGTIGVMLLCDSDRRARRPRPLRLVPDDLANELRRRAGEIAKLEIDLRKLAARNEELARENQQLRDDAQHRAGFGRLRFPIED